MTSIYAGTFDKAIPSLRMIDRSGDGILETVYDNCFDPTPLLYDCGPYVLSITKDGQPFATKDVVNHFAESSWWYELAPVKIVRTPKELLDLGYIPPYGETGIPLNAPSLGKNIFPGIMKLTPDITGGEASTGGRAEIGWTTTNVVEGLMLNDWRDALEDAKDTQTQPIHNYDNGKIINLLLRPHATHYSTAAQGGPPDWIGPHPVVPAGATPIQPSEPDTSHMADICGVISLMTGAQRYVAEQQLRTTRAFIEDAYWAIKWNQVTVWNRQARGIAWLLRALFLTYCATVEAEKAGNLPSCCWGSDYWKTIIDNQVDQFTKYIEPSDLFKKLGLVQSQDGIVAWWQHDMISPAMGLYAQMWPDVWGPIYVKCMRSLAVRTNMDGLKQWPTAMPTWYWNAVGPYVNKMFTNVPYSDYGEWLQKFYADQIAGVDPTGHQDYIALTPAQVAILKADPDNGGKFITPSQYESWTYAAIAMAVFLDRGGIKGDGPLKGAISKAYPNTEDAFTKYCAKMKNGYQFFIAPCSLSVTPQLPSTIPPTPTPTPPPPKEDPPMSDNKLSALAVAVHGITSVKDSAIAALTGLEQRLKAMVDAATGAGTQIDPAQLQALVDELNGDKDALAAAVANVPAA